MIRKLLGLAPTPERDGTFSPSRFALRAATSATTEYSPLEWPAAPAPERSRVLVIATQEGAMTMANGRRFSTGNHPVELFVPLLHLRDAGFEIDFATPTGKPVRIEMWAMPGKDDAVQEIYRASAPALSRPLSLADLVSGLGDDARYAAVFLPGGHGAMLGLPDDENVGRAIRWAHTLSRFILSICHGPAALLATMRAGGDFPFSGYCIAAFPDSLDRFTPRIGYMPGPMPWYFGEKLRELGIEIVNRRASGSVHRDRELVTGDSPKAANAFGILAARTLLETMDT
jgi:molecular chaperone Hsp31 and glyoxalase 3